MAHVAEYKKKRLAELVKLMTDYPVIAVVSVEGVPAPQLQKVRAQIRDNVVMTMAKRRIIKIALENVKETKKGIEKLKDSLGGMPALMFTKENPFKLAATLMKSKSKAPAKPGQTAPNDIIVEAGPTSFAPGPIIGELGQLGIKTAVEDGKIAIKEDKVLVKKGEVVSENAAALLTRLDIQPMEIGLMPTAAYDDGTIFKGDVLAVDEKEYINKLNIADSEAFNLAYEIKYPIKEVVEMLIGKAFNEAKAVGIEFKIIDKDVIDNLLGIAESEMIGLKETAGIEVPEKKKEIKEEKKEEVKVEEKKAEEPKEEAKSEEKKPEEVKEETLAAEEEKAEEVNAEEKKEIKEETKEEEKPAEQPKEEPIEEKKIEEPVKEKVEKEEIKKEPKQEEEKKEEPKEEEKKEEVKEEKAEEPKEEKKTEIKEDVDMSETQGVSEDAQEPAVLDKKIEEMVQKTKDFAEGNIPSAEKLVDEVEKKAEEIKKEEETEEKKEEPQKVPSAHELKEKQKGQSSDSSQKPVYSEKRKKDEEEMKAVQDIVKKIQKGEKV